MTYKSNNGFVIGQTYILRSNLSAFNDAIRTVYLKKEDIVYLVDATQDITGCVALSFIHSEYGLVKVSTYSHSDIYFRVLDEKT